MKSKSFNQSKSSSFSDVILKVIQALWKSNRTMTNLTKTNKMFRMSQVDEDTDLGTSQPTGIMNNSSFKETRLGKLGNNVRKSHFKFKLILVKIMRALENRSKLKITRTKTSQT